MTGAVIFPPAAPVDAPGGLPAAIIDAPGAAPRLGTVTLPPRGPGTTLVSVLATPLNPLDLVIASGTFHSARHELPYVPGSECTGTVIDSGRYPAGSLVYAECHASPTSPGAFATRVLVSDEDLLPLPDGTDPVLAAAVGNSGTAAFMPLIEDAGLRGGETVLVLGATGAVGQLAVQLARQHGAGRVIGAGRNRAALEHLLALGADAVIGLRPGEPEDELAGRCSRRRDQSTLSSTACSECRCRPHCAFAHPGHGWSTSATSPGRRRNCRPACCAASSSPCPASPASTLRCGTNRLR